MKRDKVLDRIENTKELWDFLVIGGGATGLGVGVDAAARGYSTLVVEQYDFSKGTSSRSTKLVHGGVRYLKQGNISLVLEALRERRTWFTRWHSSYLFTAGGRGHFTGSE
jgi:glycerol-3-phosphate dehydrogenase